MWRTRRMMILSIHYFSCALQRKFMQGKCVYGYRQY
jgi:hypothetical protein